MRFAGRISDWNDDKGFGFVMPNGGGERAFVHISGFQRGSRRPVDGDLVSYATRRDERGRWQACEIRHAGQKILPPRHSPGQSAQPSTGRSLRLPRAALGAIALVAIVIATLAGPLPVALAGLYLATSVVSWAMYFLDKSAAGRNGWRTPEINLHVVDLLGGWPGALIAQQQFRHKTAKMSFQAGFWLTVLVNVGIAAWLVGSGHAAALVG